MEMKSLSDATYIVPKSGPKNRKTATYYTVTASVHPNPEDLLTHVGSKRRNTEVSSGISMNKCSICQKEFETTDALNKHLLIHQQKFQTCGVCHGVFKQDQLMSHMLIHQKKKTYCCTHSGCRKTYNNLNSLKNHCVMRHGVHNISASLGHPASHWEPVDDHAMSTQRSYSRDMSKLLISPPHMPKAPSNAQGKYPPQVKLSKKRRESWTLLTAGKSCEVTEIEMLIEASSKRQHVEEQPVVTQVDVVDTPLNVDGFESASELPESPSEDLLLIQPSKATATTSVRSTASEDVSMLKHSLSKLKRRHSSSVVIHSPLLYPEPESDFGSDFPDPVIPPSPPGHVIRTYSSEPLPKNRKRIYSCKASKEVLSDVPASSVSQPRPKHSQEDSPHLVSLSQVALSFYSTSPGNPKESTKKPRRNEQNSCNRTYTRSPAAPKTRSQSLFDSCEKMEENISQPDDGQKGALGKKSTTKNLSPLIIPVSVPVLPTKASSYSSSPHLGQKPQSCKGLSKKSRHLAPLTISSQLPPCISSPKCTTDHTTQGSHRCGDTDGHPNQLRSPTNLAAQCVSPRVHPPSYTPPPMLSPYRLGTAHYTLLQQYPAPSSVCKAIHNDVSLSIDNTVVTIKPRINIGSRFQAEIPPVRDTLYMLYEEHPAQLVWAPWKDLTNNKKTQTRVTDLLDLCCSSALKGGGTNIELALHCLHEVQGNVPAALDLLLMREDFRTSRHPLNDYHYTGSDHWTDQEMRLFRKGLEDHGKDFHKIHLLLQTKSVAQCVEYYYIMKKLKKFKQSEQGADQKDGEKTPVFQDSQESLPERSKGNPRKRNTKGSSVRKWRCPCEEPHFQLIKDKD